MHEAYKAARYELGEVASGVLSLRQIRQEEAKWLTSELATISPWAANPQAIAGLSAHFNGDDPALNRFAIYLGDECIGAASVRSPWLKGPYLELLGLVPGRQGLGVGGLVMDWFEREAGEGARSLWLLCSDFNEGGIRFYEARGFEKICLIENLYAENLHDFLLRKIVVSKS